MMTGELALTFAPPIDRPQQDPRAQLDRSLRQAFILVGALVVVLALMASVIKVSGAVIGTGKLSVESSIKRVAHPSGGVIAALFVREGDRVRKGQPIMRFDNRVSGDSAATLGQSLDQLLAAQARLTAERDGGSSIAYPPTLTASSSPSARLAIGVADRRFATRRGSSAGSASSPASRWCCARTASPTTRARAQPSSRRTSRPPARPTTPRRPPASSSPWHG